MTFTSVAFALLACSSGQQRSDSDIPECADSYVDCGGSCSDLSGDEQNCGACGIQCAGGQTCQAGICSEMTSTGGNGNGTGGEFGTGGIASTGGSHPGTGGATPGTGGTTPATGGTAPGTGGTDPGNGSSLGNPAVPSAGCGKPPTLTSGTHSMKSATLDREYIVSLPENYDPNAPHRLVFGMHWLGGSADAVQGWSKWFGLKALDTTGSTIFVAPQGYTNGSPWRGDERDHIFFDELYAALASDLCIDTSRVFSVGFSFGAMFTNSLAQTHQDVLRGVVVYATADYNIYFPENNGKPLAYMGVHGLGDPTCPIDAGRRSKDRFVENNECTVPSSVPEAKKGSEHVTFDYDCPENYPVRWVTFDGKHTYPPNDTGTWVHGETWEFITQF